jgi:hypothetical protein
MPNCNQKKILVLTAAPPDDSHSEDDKWQVEQLDDCDPLFESMRLVTVPTSDSLKQEQLYD